MPKVRRCRPRRLAQPATFARLEEDFSSSMATSAAGTNTRAESLSSTAGPAAAPGATVAATPGAASQRRPARSPAAGAPPPAGPSSRAPRAPGPAEAGSARPRRPGPPRARRSAAPATRSRAGPADKEWKHPGPGQGERPPVVALGVEFRDSFGLPVGRMLPPDAFGIGAGGDEGSGERRVHRVDRVSRPNWSHSMPDSRCTGSSNVALKVR